MHHSLTAAALLLCLCIGCSQQPEASDSAAIGEISADALLSDAGQPGLVLDVRSREEFATGHVPGALNIPHSDLVRRISELPSDRTQQVVVYCEAGGRAAIAGKALLDAGFDNVMHLTGDMREWRERGRPLERP